MRAKQQKHSTAKRLDGKRKTLAFPRQLEEDLRLFCRERRIESESELIRQAIAKYLDSDYEDNSLKLTGLKDIQQKIVEVRDMVSVLFSYLELMHLSILSYHPEIASELKDPALASASLRHNKFIDAFRNRLKNDPPFFEKLLHDYVTGSLDG